MAISYTTSQNKKQKKTKLILYINKNLKTK